MALRDWRRFSGSVEPLFRVDSKRLEHSVTNSSCPFVGYHQGLVDKTREKIEEILSSNRLARTDRVASFQITPPPKDRESAKERALSLAEQFVAPVDGMLPGCSKPLQ
jgi:hypothetical protein